MPKSKGPRSEPSSETPPASDALSLLADELREQCHTTSDMMIMIADMVRQTQLNQQAFQQQQMQQQMDF
eukprot:Gb_40000 [translate_table: standard]